ncbi:MAG: hypothetical protein ACQETO_03355 [Pseudomonadota bacterium]
MKSKVNDSCFSATGKAIAGFFLLMSPALVAADVTAVFDLDGESVTIEYRDDQNVRMRAPGDSYLMRQNDEVYVISRQGEDWQVLALSDFAAMMGGMANSGQESATETEESYDFRDTGRTEVVAGIEGNVHEVIETDGWGDEEVAAEVVLTDHEGAVQAHRGMISIISAMGAMAGEQGLGDLMDTAYGGENRAVLRSNDDWRLVSLDEGRIPDNHFVLPAEPTTIPGFGGGGGNRAASNGGEAPDVDTNAAGSWLESFSEEVGRGAAEEAQEETERGVTESVRDGIRDGIRGIFGR